jgi:hypothetical protein
LKIINNLCLNLYVYLLQGALTGSIVSLILVGAVSLGAQSEIASGHYKHQMLPMSTHECAANFSVISRPE